MLKKTKKEIGGKDSEHDRQFYRLFLLGENVSNFGENALEANPTATEGCPIYSGRSRFR